MFEYETLLQEEKLTVKDLPNPLQAKIRGMNMLVAKLQKNPNSPSLKDSVKRCDLNVADAVQNYIEKDLPLEEETPQETEEQKLKREKEDKERVEREKVLAEQGKALEVKNAIIAKINSHPQKCIERKDLEEMLGKKIHDRIDLGGVMLRQIYLTQRFRVYNGW